MNTIFPMQSDHPLFRYFTEEERSAIEQKGLLNRVDGGMYLIAMNEDDSTLFAVEEGTLEVVYVGRDGEEKVLATVGPGDVLGEGSFIDGSPRSMSVRAAEDSLVRTWERGVPVAELQKNPEMLAKFAVAMSELLLERMRDNMRRQVVTQRVEA
ncbi:MAG: Crp/Fnr family transcriptional regulator [Thermoanaerobaculia bacterium]